MSTPPSLSDAPLPVGVLPPVGRLVPLEGVVVQEHHDRALLQRFLQELQAPLAVIDSFTDLAGIAAEPAAGEALAVVSQQVRYLRELIGDYRTYERLEADRVAMAPLPVAAHRWLPQLLQAQADAARAAGAELELRFRSFLPDRVVFDPELAAQAVTAVLRTALDRALPGPATLAIAYDWQPAGGGPPMLHLDLDTRGGGFPELAQGYAFTPFATRDRDERPRLGLSIARRLCQLLGGDLRLDSDGLAACGYRLSFAAPPATGAVWIDPVADRTLGPLPSRRS